MSHRLQVTFDEDLWLALQEESARTGAALAEVVRRSVGEKLGISGAKDRQKLLARTAGLWADRTESGLEIQADLRSGLTDRPANRRLHSTTGKPKR
jgi:hypothetical protein